MGSLVTLAAATAVTPGTAQLTIDGETTIHQISDCSLRAQDGLPARLLIQDIDVTLNLSQADHMQVISIIRDNSNWGATRMFNGEGWLDRGQPSTPIVSEWGEVIRVEARLTSNGGTGDKQVSLIAQCT